MCYETSKNQQKIKLNGNREKLTLEYFMERKKIFWKKRNRIRTSKRQLAEYKNWKLLDGKEMRGRGELQDHVSKVVYKERVLECDEYRCIRSVKER